MQHHELVALAHQEEAPPPDETTPSWAGAFDSTCTGCGATDNHPVVMVVLDFGETDGDGNVVRPSKVERWHHDCHALATHNPSTVAVVEQSGGLKGHELRVFLHGDPTRNVAPEFVTPETEES